jgi:hypothetical protein
VCLPALHHVHHGALLLLVDHAVHERQGRLFGWRRGEGRRVLDRTELREDETPDAREDAETP